MDGRRLVVGTSAVSACWSVLWGRGDGEVWCSLGRDFLGEQFRPRCTVDAWAIP